MGFEDLFERERRRYEDGIDRGEAEQLVRVANAAWGAGLSLLMLGRYEEAGEWLDRAASRWRESWAHATPTSWGRPIGSIKAELIAGRAQEAAGYARWALELGTAGAESPIGRYAAALALLVLERWDEAAEIASGLVERDDFPPEVADALAAIGSADAAAYRDAVERVLVSFETREEYLEDVPVADTVIVLQALAGRRGFAAELSSALLPGSG
jgi:tetratricopeptide (TPR) repeat protein